MVQTLDEYLLDKTRDDHDEDAREAEGGY